jgi:hypothetical protein
MSRLALLVASLALVACAGSSPWAGGSAQSSTEAGPDLTPATEGAAGQGTRYSWQKDEAAVTTEEAPKDGAPEDETKARIQAKRPEHALIALAMRNKPEPGTTLQLTKNGEAILVKVVRSDDTTTIADILAVQDPAKLRKFLDSLEAGDEVLCGPPADLPAAE